MTYQIQRTFEAVTDWYEQVREYTTRLVNIRSVSPGVGEREVALEVHRLLCRGGLEQVYALSGLDPLEHDAYARENAYAFLRGTSTKTLVLLGHIDTVDTKDYGPAEPFALDPARLNTLRNMLMRRGEETTYSDDWYFGRGSIDMKCGVAVNIAVMRACAEAARATSFPLSIVFLATPDEENESAGVLQAVRFLHRLRERYGLDYIGAINTDYTTAQYAGDPHRYIFTGTVGKLLPSFLCIGRESHVGDPFKGVDANLLAAELMRDLSMNDALCDYVRGQITSPPVTLHATDLKTQYDVQLPFAAYFYLNVLTFTTEPHVLLERLQERAEDVLTQLLARLDETEQRWRRVNGTVQQTGSVQARVGSVLTYEQLYAETVQQLGTAQVEAALTAEWQCLPDTLDKRERSLRLVHRLWTLGGRQGPAVILYYSPPYYPHVAATPCALQDALSAVVAAHPEQQLVMQEYYPYLSDMSYLRLDAGVDISALKANMPVWRERQPEKPPLSGSYHLPLEDIQQLALPVVNFGPYGRGAHQRDESLLMSYSFGMLPQLLYETIERLADQG